MNINLKEMLSEFVYGGMDGVLTTVAIIAGILGADISTKYALILGLANILADGFSMGISRYNSLVDIESGNSELSRTSPLLSGLATFVFFVMMGPIPLFPFLINVEKENIGKWLMFSSFTAFLLIGSIKGLYSKNMMKSIFEVVVIGSIGASISYFVSSYMKHCFIDEPSKPYDDDDDSYDEYDDDFLDDYSFANCNNDMYSML